MFWFSFFKPTIKASSPSRKLYTENVSNTLKVPSETVTFTTFTPRGLNFFSTKVLPLAVPISTPGTALSTNQVYVGLTKLL